MEQEAVVVHAPEQPLTEFQKWQADAAAPEVEETGGELAIVPAAEAAPVADPEKNAETAPAGEPEDADTEDVTPGIKKRFAKLTARNSELNRQLAALQAQIEGVKTPAKPAEAAAPAQTAADPGEPKLENFEDYATYNKAFLQYQFAQLVKQQNAAAAQREALAKRATLLNAAKEAHPDFEEVVLEAGSKIPISKTLSDFISADDQGPELAYWLAKHPTDLARISALNDPMKTAKEMGMIAAKLAAPEAATAAKPVAVSKAPKPVTPITSTPGRDDSHEPDPKDFRKWNAWKDRQEARDAA